MYFGDIPLYELHFLHDEVSDCFRSIEFSLFEVDFPSAGHLPFHRRAILRPYGVLPRSGFPQKIEKLLCRLFFPIDSLSKSQCF